jgi:hypothetical protein
MQQLRVFYVLPALTTTFVAARIFASLKLDIGLGADDWVMVGALGAYLADVGTGYGMIVQGFWTAYLLLDNLSNYQGASGRLATSGILF